MNLKTKTKIRLAVADYMKMFPEDWKECQVEIDWQRQNLVDDMAQVKGTHYLKRALFTLPAKLSGMIARKLTTEEQLQLAEKDNARWFAKEFPMFAITKAV